MRSATKRANKLSEGKDREWEPGMLCRGHDRTTTGRGTKNHAPALGNRKNSSQ